MPIKSYLFSSSLNSVNFGWKCVLVLVIRLVCKSHHFFIWPFECQISGLISVHSIFFVVLFLAPPPYTDQPPPPYTPNVPPTRPVYQVLPAYTAQPNASGFHEYCASYIVKVYSICSKTWDGKRKYSGRLMLGRDVCFLLGFGCFSIY